MKKKKYKSTIDIAKEALFEASCEGKVQPVIGDNDQLLPSNTHEALLEGYSKQMDNLKQDMPTIKDFEDSYQEQFRGVDLDLRDMYEQIESTPLSIFLYCADSGFYPPPEVMFCLKNSFDSYFAAEGNFELEQVFFGKKTQRIGNFAARKSRDSQFESFHYFCDLERMSDSAQKCKPRTLSELYFDYFTNNNSLTNGLPFAFLRSMTPEENEGEEAFLKGYQRWKT